MLPRYLSVTALLSFVLVANAATVYFSIDIRNEWRSPDGVIRPQITVNGSSPGPALFADQEDTIHFLVRNHLSAPTSIHFHGISVADFHHGQLGTPWSDGTPGLSQKPIPPNATFLYKWVAYDYGTFWYHSHARSQVSDGCFGAIHIRARNQKSPFYKIDSEPKALRAMELAEAAPQVVMISDWRERDSEAEHQLQKKSNMDLSCVRSILINGIGRVNCLADTERQDLITPAMKKLLRGRELSPDGCLPSTIRKIQGDYEFDRGKLPSSYGECHATYTAQETFVVDGQSDWVSFNFISSTTIVAPVVSIDGHPLWLYAVDGRYVEPVQVDGFRIFNGERYSFMVELNQPPGNYTIRVANAGASQLISGFATMQYHGIHTAVIDAEPFFKYNAEPAKKGARLLDPETQIIPYPNVPPSKKVDVTQIMHIVRELHPWQWSMKNTKAWPSSYAFCEPLLHNPWSRKARDSDLVLRTNNGTWIDIVWIVDVDSKTPIQPPHPMHKHSTKAYVIGSGVGEWKWKTVAEAANEQPGLFNLENPPLRDTYVTPPAAAKPSWLAIRYQVVNPGAFLIHCHTQTHLQGGLALALLEGVDVWPEIPLEYRNVGDGRDQALVLQSDWGLWRSLLRLRSYLMC